MAGIDDEGIVVNVHKIVVFVCVWERERGATGHQWCGRGKKKKKKRRRREKGRGKDFIYPTNNNKKKVTSVTNQRSSWQRSHDWLTVQPYLQSNPD